MTPGDLREHGEAKHTRDDGEGDDPRDTAVGTHSGFACTGAYTTMLGTVLPLLAAQWVMPDSRAGMLFLAQFCGSMLGALLRAPQLPRLIAAGFACIAGSCAAFALLSPALGPGYGLPPAFCFFSLDSASEQQ